MIDPLTREDLQRLAGEQTTPCVSLYMPTLRIGSDALQNVVRLKNLLVEAEENLAAHRRRVEVRDFMCPIGKLLQDGTLWNDLSSGLALFRCEETLRYWRLPLAFETFVWVGDRFYIKPLLPLATHNDRFYLVAVSQSEVRLFKGSRHDLREIHPAKLPNSLVEALHLHQPEGMFQVRTVSTAVHGKEGAVFHGQDARRSIPRMTFSRISGSSIEPSTTFSRTSKHPWFLRAWNTCFQFSAAPTAIGNFSNSRSSAT